jgi:hypothetical protein
MKNILIYMMLFMATGLRAQTHNLHKIRMDFGEAIENGDKANALCKQLKGIKDPDAIVLAYLGSAQAVRAKFAWNPVSKVAHLKEGFANINKAIAKDPNNLEVRFLRFSLEFHVPKFLGYSENLSADKNKIITILEQKDKAAQTLDRNILENMVKMLINSKLCNSKEIGILKKAIS